MKFYKEQNNKKGFTLVEIIVVLVIIGILMALAVPAVMKYINEAAETKAKSQARAGFMAAQAVAMEMIRENPGVSSRTIQDKINSADVINTELGIEKENGKWPAEKGAVNEMQCSVKEDNHIEACIIRLSDNGDRYWVSQNELEKY